MTHLSDRIRILINIDVAPGVAGGIVQSTQGLVSSLGQLDGPEEYMLLAHTPTQAEWIKQYCGPNQQIVMAPRKTWLNGTANHSQGSRGIKEIFRPALNIIRHAVGRLSPPSDSPIVTVSDGTYERLGCDVVHFPTQSFILCALPTIYNPHDLQHLHYPQFFTPKELLGRETSYRAACQLSNTVVVGSEWIKKDVISQYGVSPDKVQIIPWAPPTAQYAPITSEQTESTRTRLGLSEPYALYPAVTWAHKNHLRLLEALAQLRDNAGIVVRLICTGARHSAFWPKIEERIRHLNLASQVKFLGFLSESDLRVVYRSAQFLVLPSLFEADSCPIHEAWSEGIPVASSNLTGLPDQVGDAGLLFDAMDVSALAKAIQSMATDADLRRQLVDRGFRRVKDFDWVRTAKAYRAVYRRAAGLRLDDEERWLLQWDWMREPNKSRPARTT